MNPKTSTSQIGSLGSDGGCFMLFEVKRIYYKQSLGFGMNWYSVCLNNGMRIAATKYNAWVVIRNGCEIALPTEKLKKGDKFWVDVTAFPICPVWFDNSSKI